MPDWVIYVLKNPRTRAVKYVGWTSRTPEARLYAHIYYSVALHRTRAHQWVLSLVSIGLDPLIDVIDSGTGTAFKDAERHWIAFYRAQGCDLVNGTDGGDGPPPGMMTPELRRAKAIKAMASRTPEARSEAARQSRMSLTPEQRRANIDKVNAVRTGEQRRKSAQLAKANYSPARRKEATRRAGLALQAGLTPEQRSARDQAFRNMISKRTFEEHSAAMKKGQAARRSRLAQIMTQ